jgi:hypothetical protein
MHILSYRLQLFVQRPANTAVDAFGSKCRRVIFVDSHSNLDFFYLEITVV